MTRGSRLVPLLFIVALSAGYGCPPDNPSSSPVGAVSADTGIRECPEAHHADSVVLLLTGGTAGIPEYNDCQRFIVAGQYDKLYAIYATHPPTVSLGPTIAVLVAVIQSFGGSYPALGIKPGFNCVYLSSDRRSARVIPSVNRVAPCPAFIRWSRLLPGKLLESRPTVVKGFEADSNYPQVARWDYTPDSVQYMGLKCESAWCEIGPQGFVSSPAWTPATNLTYKMRRNMLIKGWYDEQFLAGPAAVSGGPATVTDNRGTIFPSDSLADYTDAMFTKTWRVIAYAAMSKKSPKYLARMNFVATPSANPATPLDPTKLNTIELCVGTKDDCQVADPVPTCPAIAAGSDALVWGWSRLKQAGGSNYLYKCIIQWPNAGMIDFTGTPLFLPAASRWRWVLADETTWSRCAAGCCEVH